MSDDEYRIKLTLRNNLLLSAIEAAGYKTQSEFARAAGLHPAELNALVAMRKAPIGASGEFCEAAKLVMEALGAAPLDLWTEKQLTLALERNTGERTMSEVSVEQLIGEHTQNMTLPDPCEDAERGEVAQIVNSVIEGLKPKHQQVIRMRFGIGCKEMTLKEVGHSFGVTPEYIRSIEARALRALRHPINSEKMRPFWRMATNEPLPSLRHP